MIFINGFTYPRFETETWGNLEMGYFGFVNLQSYLTINSPYSNTCNITHANLNTKKVVSACKSFVYPIRFGNEMEKTEKQTCIKCSPFESNERRLQSRFSKLATKYRFNRLKSKSRKDDGREKCPLQDDPHLPKSSFYLSLFLRKRTYRPFNSIHINKKQEQIKIS